MSDMTLSAAMRRMHAADLTEGHAGFVDRVSKRPAVPHGLRSTFRDWAAERTHFPGDMAEVALAHKVGNAVEAAYRRGDMVEKRRALMTAWADFLIGKDGSVAEDVEDRMTEDDPLYFWRLVPELTLVDAAILVAGGDPSVTDKERQGLGTRSHLRGGQENEAAFQLHSRVHSPEIGRSRKELPAHLRYKGRKGEEREPSPEDPYWIVSPNELEAVIDPQRPHLTRISNSGTSIYIESEPDWGASSVDVIELRRWLNSRGHRSGFFFPPDTRETTPDSFLEPSHDHFAPELALGVLAWRALESKSVFPRGPKAEIERWIDTNPDAWHGDVDLSVSAKERIVTVVNWRKSGGAPSSSG